MASDYIISTEFGDLNIEVTALNQSSHIIDELIAIRKSRNLTQQDIADATGMCRANIARIECKKYTPTIEVLMRYADCLGYSISLSLTEKGAK